MDIWGRLAQDAAERLHVEFRWDWLQGIAVRQETERERIEAALYSAAGLALQRVLERFRGEGVPQEG